MTIIATILIFICMFKVRILEDIKHAWPIGSKLRRLYVIYIGTYVVS